MCCVLVFRSLDMWICTIYQSSYSEPNIYIVFSHLPCFCLYQLLVKVCFREESHWTIPIQKQIILMLHELAERSETLNLKLQTYTHCYLIKPLKLTDRFNTVLVTFLRDFQLTCCVDATCCLAVSFLVIFSPSELMLTGYFLFSGPLSLNTRDK